MTRKLALILISASLTACATHTSIAPPDLSPFLQPTLVEGKYPSLDAVMRDSASTTYDLYLFGGNAEDGVQRCNADKASARRVLNLPLK